MSKITFRADDDLVAAVEDLDASKSEVMRDALRAYLEDDGSSGVPGDSIDDVVAERVDELFERRRAARPPERDVNVRITVETEEGVRADARQDAGHEPRHDRRQPPARGGERADGNRSQNTCAQCGESLSDDHVYCPNCGEKATRRVFCECGDEIRADWVFCPHCGRRTASADALDG